MFLKIGFSETLEFVELRNTDAILIKKIFILFIHLMNFVYEQLAHVTVEKRLLN